MDYKAEIERACQVYGLDIKGWADDPEEGRPYANLGRVRVLEDDEEEGLFADELGVLYAGVVGSEQYGNRHVAFHLVADGMDPDALVRVNDPSMQVELI